jgi:hypothetical protein
MRSLRAYGSSSGLAYREYITGLGEGVLGSFIRIYPTWRIESELAEWRSRINKYWFWDAGKDLLPKERALEFVIIGDTVNGDEIVFHPFRRNRLINSREKRINYRPRSHPTMLGRRVRQLSNRVGRNPDPLR